MKALLTATRTVRTVRALAATALVGLAGAAAAASAATASAATASTAAASAATAAGFTLASPDIAANSTIGAPHVFNSWGCTGGNISPRLEWSGAPEGTQSFALTVYDPDAPTGSGFWHWVVVNIPASAHALSSGAGTADGKALPAGSLQVSTDFGAPGYGGPCPPVGDKPHRYIFTLYALKAPKLDLPEHATAAVAGFMIHFNVIGQASFTATYGR
jgi:Raf kinase inhibitor-like YbhB/YbcL family protein